MTSYVLGVDAGGTKTLAALADDAGRILGVGVGGPGNWDGVGTERAGRSLNQAVGGALAAAGGALPSAVFAGIAGVVTEAGRQVARGLLAPTLGQACGVAEIDHDCRVALAGGLSGQPGIVLIAGTGTACFGRTADKREWRSSGWGSLFGDEGSSYWIVVQAIRAVLRADDGRSPRTGLRAALLSAMGVANADEILAEANRGRWDRTSIAALAPLVILTAQAGDSVARGLMAEAAKELAEAVEAVSRALEFDQARFDVVGVGGFLRSSEIWTALKNRLRETQPQASLIEPQLTPVAGAALLAIARLRDAPPEALPEDVVESLRNSGKQFGL